MTAQITPPSTSSFSAGDWQRLARCWFPVATVSEIGNKPVSATLLDEQLVIYRTQGEIVIAKNVCPHRGVPLTLGSVEEKGIVCPYHGLRFGEGGRCNRIPASPDQAVPSKLNLSTFPAEERYGLIWTCLAPEQGTAPQIPQMPHWDDEGFQHIVCDPFDIAGFAGRQVEGFLDVAHFAWIHTDTFADPDNMEVPDYTVTETEQGFSADYLSSMANYAKGSGLESPEGFRWLRHFEMYLPFTASLTVHFPDNGRLAILNAASPVSARKTRLFVPIAKNFDKHIPVQDIKEFNRRVFAEDAGMVETQRPENLPLDLSLEAHIPADRSSVAYRRGLKKMGFSDFFLV